MALNLFPADTYIVKNSTMLNNEDRNVLIKLYEPVIGAVAVNLYFTFLSNLDTSLIISTEYTHHNLMTSTRLRLSDILEAREKLEGIGLIKTYVKEGSVNSYVYELYSPVEPKEFFENPILSVTLESNVGRREYKRIMKFFAIPSVDLTGYKDVTLKFSDVFDTSISSVTSAENIRSVRSLDLVIDEKIDLNNLLSLIPSELLNKRSVTKEVRSLIYKLAYIYNLDEDVLSELIRNSINEKHIIDGDLLRENCRNYYSFENKNSSPSLVYKNSPEYLRSSITGDSKKSKLIYTFETTSPYDFLSGKNKGVKPSKSDLNLVETLLVDYDLSPGVVNVLIDYVLRINNNKLTKNFVTTIASQWKRSNVKTVLEAMDICRKENSTKKKSVRTIKKEEKPDWFNKRFEEKEASLEDIKKLEDKLQNL